MDDKLPYTTDLTKHDDIREMILSLLFIVERWDNGPEREEAIGNLLVEALGQNHKDMVNRQKNNDQPA